MSNKKSWEVVIQSYRNATFLVQVSAIGNARPNICAECYKAMLQEAIDSTF